MLRNGAAGVAHAAQTYRHHWDTPTSIVVDALGRTVLAIARDRAGPDAPTEEFRTASTYDNRGNLLALTEGPVCHSAWGSDARSASNSGSDAILVQFRLFCAD
jgi:hypothetical protein